MSNTQDPRFFFPKLIRRTMRMAGTGMVVALAAGAIWQGSAMIAQRASAVEGPAPTAAIAVSVSPFEIVDGYTVKRRFSGQIEAPQSASVSFEQGGTLKTVLVDDGDTVLAGQTLAMLDDRLLRADVARLKASKTALEAQLELATLTDKRQAELQTKGFASAQSADQTRLSIVELNARLAEIEASILAASIRLEKAVIRAPFDGRVNTRLSDPGNTVAAGQAVLALVEDGQPVFRVGVAPDLIAQLQIGSAMEILLSGETRTAEIIAILPQIDPVTRTRVVRARLDDRSDLAFGQTGEALLAQTIRSRGSWIPVAALEDGIRGLWTIKTVSGPAPYHVAIESAEIIHADGENAFVRGTFSDGDRFINTGVHRVAAGQTVRVMD
jgi:RND family efflux transporter MFP subunit